MLERWLDVAYQWRWRLLALVVVIPCLVLAVGVVADRSRPVAARLWVGKPIVLLAAPSTSGSARPADLATQRLGEWLRGDAFADRVLTAADPGFASLDVDRQSARRQDLRTRVTGSSDGDDVIVLAYRGGDPAYGRALLTSLIAQFEAMTVTTVTDRVSAPAAPLTAARAAVRSAFAGLGTQAAPATAQDGRNYLAYQALLALAGGPVDAYRVRADQARLSPAELAILERGMFELVDPPAVVDRTPIVPPAVLLGLGLGLAGAAGLVLVSRAALRDGRVRSVDEVQRRTGMRYLGSTGAVTTP